MNTAFKAISLLIVHCAFLNLAFAQAEVQEEPTLAEQEINQALNLVKEVEAEAQPAKVETPASEKIAEDQIALNLDTKKARSAEAGSALNFVLGFSILGILLSGGYFLLRKYSIPKQSRHQTQIKVIQQHYLGPKKSLTLVRVAGETILLGVTDQNITHLKTLSLLDDEVPVETPEKFEGVLKGMAGSPSFDDSEEEADQFAIRGIRDVVSSKLKGMRSLDK